MLRTVVERAVLMMFHTWEHVPLRRTIAFELIRDDDPRDVRQPFQQLAKELLRGVLVSPPLHQDVQHMPLLIDRAPEILAYPIDRQKDLVEMPCVTGSKTSASQLIAIWLPELHAPLANGFIRDDDSSGEHQLFDIAIAQAAANVQPDPVADDLCGEPMAPVGMRCWWSIHGPSMSHEGSTGKGKITLTIPPVRLRECFDLTPMASRRASSKSRARLPDRA
jgi:hypothetical protein